jgi:raffinose synthase
MRDTAVARASDDFYPRDPTSSHPHIAACAYNTLFLSAILHVRRRRACADASA